MLFGFFNWPFKNQLVSELKKNAEIVSLFKRDEANQSEVCPAVGNEVTRSEFLERYKRQLLSQRILGASIILLLILLWFAPNWLSLTICLCTEINLCLLYFKFCHHLWRANLVWLRWEERTRPLVTTEKEFLRVCLNKPKSLFPTLLK